MRSRCRLKRAPVESSANFMRIPLRPMKAIFGITAILAVLSVVGCSPQTVSDSSSETNNAASAPSKSVPLRVAVYREQDLADQIASGWQGVSDQAVQSHIFNDDDLLDKIAAQSDLIVMPARRLGEAAVGGWIAPLPQSYLDSKPVSRGSFLLQLRSTQMTWAGDTYGLSLGSPVAAVMVRDDVSGLPEDQALTYESLNQWAAQLGEDQPLVAEPLAERQAAESFLRRAASCTASQWLFDRQDMTPMLDQPPYVRALQQMVEFNKHSPKERLTAEQIWQRITAGKLRLALGWPMASTDAADAASVRILPPPGAAQIFTTDWQPNNQTHRGRWVLPGSGYVVTISAHCRQTSASRALAAWMSREGLPSLRRTSAQITTVRLNADTDTSFQALNPALVAYDDLASKLLSSPLALHPLRIQASNRYIDALDTCVLAAVDGKLSAEDALRQAKDMWIEINQEIGLEQQRNFWTQNRMR